MLKVVKAKIQKEHASLPLGAQEREAFADPRYEEQLNKIKEAIEIDETNKREEKAADILCEAWRSQCANERAVKL